MTLSEEQRESFREAAQPLMKWLSENGHPHCEVTVTSDRAELTEGVASVGVKE